MEKKGGSSISSYPQTIPRGPGSPGQLDYGAEGGRYLDGGSLFLGVLVGTITGLILNLAAKVPREEV